MKPFPAHALAPHPHVVGSTERSLSSRGQALATGPSPLPRARSGGWIRGCTFFGCSLLFLAAHSLSGAAIPDRPEALTFPELTYNPPAPADYRVELKSGPVAYLIPDTTLPLIQITILVRCGSYLDPTDKIGLAQFTGQLMTRAGTQDRSAEDLEERLAFLAAQLSSSVGEESASVSLNLLSKDLNEGLSILREILTQPGFQPDKVELHRQQTLQSLQQRNDDSSNIEAREARWLAYGQDFWASRQPTSKTIAAIAREDLLAFQSRWFNPVNFVVAVSGDFQRNNMIQHLEQLFSHWPIQGNPAPQIPTDFSMAEPGLYISSKEVNQGRVTFLLPGVHRDHPDYPAIQIMNDILGGGGFTSRIMSRVRSDEGLAYGASSRFAGGVYFPRAFTAGFASKSRTVAYAASIVLEELKRIQSEPVSESEIETAKRSFIDTFPQNFGSSDRTAALFASEELTGRFAKDPQYWQLWRDRYEAVTLEDVQRVAHDHLALDRLVLLVVGDREELLKGHPDYPARLQDLVPGSVHELPLRDPLTLETK